MYKHVNQNGLAVMLAVKRSAAVALEVNLRIPLHAGNEPNRGFGIQGINHQKYKTEVSVAGDKTLIVKTEFRDY